MHEAWWESPTCWICDRWWLLLGLLIAGGSAYLARAYWLPDQMDLCFSGRSPIPLSEALPATWGDIDVVFAFDQSGSMGPVLDGAKAEALSVMDTLAARLWTERFGLIGFSDYVDVPYALYEPVTTERQRVAAAIQGLALFHGGDTPEAYGRVMYESQADARINWTPGARRYLVIFGDSVPHAIDPGRDGILTTTDDLEINAVVGQIKAAGISLVFVANPGVDLGLPPMDQWSSFADATVGSVVGCEPGGAPR